MSSSSSKQEPCGPHGRLELGRLYPLGAAMTFALDMEDAHAAGHPGGAGASRKEC